MNETYPDAKVYIPVKEPVVKVEPGLPFTLAVDAATFDRLTTPPQPVGNRKDRRRAASLMRKAMKRK